MIVGIAPLGSRGRAIGDRLRVAGERVLGYDPDVAIAASSGLRTAGSPERLAQQCALELVACDGEEADALISQLLQFQGIADLQAIALCGALDPRRVQELASIAAGKGVALLDTPVDGGEPAILAGRGVVFAGGSETAVDDFRQVLQALGTLVYVGDAGSGQIARTVNDLLRWANVLAISDAFSLVRACGANPAPIREAVLRASGSNRALAEWSADGASAAREDIQAALELARETGAAMPFLRELDALLDQLDADQLAGLFNLGIADLSAHELPEAQADVVAEFVPESEAPPQFVPEIAAADEAALPVEHDGVAALGAPAPDVSAFEAELAAVETVAEPSPDQVEPRLEEPELLEAFGTPAAEGDSEGWDLDMEESDAAGGEPTIS